MAMEFTLPLGFVTELQAGDMATYDYRDYTIKFARPGIGPFQPAPAFRLCPGDDPVVFLEKRLPLFRVRSGQQGGVKHYFLELRDDEPTLKLPRKRKEK